jgi:secreted trypsin-like serine protease
LKQAICGDWGSLIAIMLCAVFSAPASALVGGAELAQSNVARQVVMIKDWRGRYCTGTLLARDIVLTAAHCVWATTGLTVSGSGDAGAESHEVIAIVAHPQYDDGSYAKSQAAVDLALLKLREPLFDSLPVIMRGRVPLPGERFIVAGFGVTAPGSLAGLGTLRAATLVAAGEPSSMQLRLVDPASRGGAIAGLGSCYGDSGGPVFAWNSGRFLLIGVLSWSNGPNMSTGCGGFTGATPLARYQEWMVKMTKGMERGLN